MKKNELVPLRARIAELEAEGLIIRSRLATLERAERDRLDTEFHMPDTLERDAIDRQVASAIDMATRGSSTVIHVRDDERAERLRLALSNAGLPATAVTVVVGEGRRRG